MAIAWRWTRVLVHFMRGWAIVVFVFPFLDQARRDLHVLEWAQRLLKLLRIKLTCRGMFPNNGCIIVANHVSWLDIMAIDAVVPSRFVSKAEVGRWPLVGALVTAAGQGIGRRAGGPRRHRRTAARSHR